MTKQKGFILFITFSMLALCATLVTMFMIKGIAHKKLSAALLQQEQLVDFAVSCTALGQSYLSLPIEDIKATDKNKDSDTTEQVHPSKKILEKYLVAREKKQEFNFQEIDASFPLLINLTFFSESGKININGLYDLVEQKFYDEGISGKDRKFFATWLFDKIAIITGRPSLLLPFIEYVKQRKSPFNDVTELLAIKEFSLCFSDIIFYNKELAGSTKKSSDKKIFLTDLFTVSSETDLIQPWLLSPSVCALLDIAQKNNKNDILERNEKKIDTSSFKQQSDWSKDWDVSLKPLYGISYDQVPEPVRGMLASQFSPTVFSVMTTVFKKDMIARVFAILKQKRLPNGAIMYDVIKTYQV